MDWITPFLTVTNRRWGPIWKRSQERKPKAEIMLKIVEWLGKSVPGKLEIQMFYNWNKPQEISRIFTKATEWEKTLESLFWLNPVHHEYSQFLNNNPHSSFTKVFSFLLRYRRSQVCGNCGLVTEHLGCRVLFLRVSTSLRIMRKMTPRKVQWCIQGPHSMSGKARLWKPERHDSDRLF